MNTRTSKLLSILLALVLLLSLAPVSALAAAEGSEPEDPVTLSEAKDPEEDALPAAPSQNDSDEQTPAEETAAEPESPVIPEIATDSEKNAPSDEPAPDDSAPAQKTSSVPAVKLGAPEDPPGDPAGKFPVKVVITTWDKDDKVISTVGGTATADKTEAAKGETIIVTATPNEGFEVESIGFSDGVAGDYQVGKETSFIVPDDFTTSTGNLQIDVVFKEKSAPTTYTVKLTGGVNYYTNEKEFTAQEKDLITIHADISKIPAGKYIVKFTDEENSFTITDPHFTMPGHDLDLKAEYADQTEKVIDLSSGTADISFDLGDECPFIDSTGHNPFAQPVGTQMDVNEDGTPDIEITKQDYEGRLVTLKSLNSDASELRQSLPGYRYVFVYRFSTAAITYTVTGGADSTWTKDSSPAVTITVKRSEADDTCFSHFTGVQIDGTTLAASDYDAKAGSTVITLKAATLRKLSNGSHTVTINFDDGNAKTKLTVKAASADKADETDSGNTGKTDTDKTGKTDTDNTGKTDTDKTGKTDSDKTGKTDSDKTGKTDSGNTVKTDSGNTVKTNTGNNGVAAAPKTGDSSPLALWSLVLITAAAAILVLLKRRVTE